MLSPSILQGKLREASVDEVFHRVYTEHGEGFNMTTETLRGVYHLTELTTKS